MLPFGSLFTQIPLLILGSVYLVYFGASTIKKIQASEDEKSVENVVTVSSELTSSPSSLPDFRQISQDNEALVAETSAEIIPVPPSGKNYKFVYQASEIISSADFYLFSRPPPVTII